MKKAGKALLAGVVVVMVAVVAGIPAWPRIAVRLFADANNLKVTYGQMKKASLGEMIFKDMTVTDRARGIGIASEDAVIRPLWNGPDPRNATIAFDFRKVRFLKTTPEKAVSYNNLDGLVALPFNSSVTYPEISGKVHSDDKAVTVKDLLAKSDDIKLSFNGTITRDNKITSDIVIYFADNLTNRIPPEMAKLALNQEDAGWKSLSVKLDGDFSAPRIQVSSKLFRLKVGVKED